MTVSTGAIDLGDITTNQTGSLTVTLSTNSPTGLTLNATSQEGGLRYTS
jgi:hypothetical protein